MMTFADASISIVYISVNDACERLRAVRGGSATDVLLVRQSARQLRSAAKSSCERPRVTRNPPICIAVAGELCYKSLRCEDKRYLMDNSGSRHDWSQDRAEGKQWSSSISKRGSRLPIANTIKNICARYLCRCEKLLCLRGARFSSCPEYYFSYVYRLRVAASVVGIATAAVRYVQFLSTRLTISRMRLTPFGTSNSIYM